MHISLRGSVLHCGFYFLNLVHPHVLLNTNRQSPMKTTLLLLLLAHAGVCQIKELNPVKVTPLNFSAEGEKAFTDALIQFKKIEDKLSKGVKYDDLTAAEKKAYSEVDENNQDYWGSIGDGCSWYCGEGTKKVTASSYLQAQGASTYVAKNVHDFSYKNAWVEGAPGYGIGEFVEYTFSATAPRVTDILIANGFVKSQAAWANNARVKKLKMYLNNKPYAILNLKDERALQTFKVDPLGYDGEVREKHKGKPDWTLKFEIMEVYKGLKYEDVVIAELFFDGLDVHCFASGTKILMADNSTRNIEDLKVGDPILFFDFETQKLKSTTIEKLISVMHHGLVTYQFESGLTITSTQDHPYQVLKKGWASLKPDQSAQYEGFEGIQKIEVGDFFITYQGPERLTAITHLAGHHQTFTITKLSVGDNFIANGLVVGTEILQSVKNTLATD